MFGKLRHLARASYHYLLPTLAFRRYIEKRDADEIEMDYLDVLVDSRRCAVDVGANLGRYSVRLAGLATQVFAFEPHPRLARILKKSLPGNVIVRQAAVSSEAGSLSLHIPLEREQQVESLATLEPLRGRAAHWTISVPTVTLDDLADRDIGFVKIDVEGHELDVVRGGLRLLASQRPIVLAEADEHHHAGTTTALFCLMESAGYKGMFLWRDRVCDVAEFDAATMQNERELHSERQRKLCPYVNNFVFAPAGETFATIRGRLAARLG
jgi:FkbM family methyltransferase